MNSYTLGWVVFRYYALGRGYPHKVIGDESFSKSNRPNSNRIRLLKIDYFNKIVIVKEDNKDEVRLPLPMLPSSTI
jgi:hypothetical protein